MAEKKDELKFYVLEKRDDGEDVKAVTEAELAKLADPTKAEVFLSEADAQKRKGEVAFARIQQAHRKRAAKAKVARQRAQFAKDHPDQAAKYRHLAETALEKHLRATEKYNEAVPAEQRLDTTKLEAAIKREKTQAVAV